MTCTQARVKFGYNMKSLIYTFPIQMSILRVARGPSRPASWYRERCRCFLGDREYLSKPRQVTLNAISSEMMQSYKANDLSDKELASILARPRIDFSSVLDIVRFPCCW